MKTFMSLFCAYQPVEIFVAKTNFWLDNITIVINMYVVTNTIHAVSNIFYLFTNIFDRNYPMTYLLSLLNSLTNLKRK
jgi:hypothetical protein